MRKPRICIVIAGFFHDEAGAEKQARVQSRSLHDRGYEVTVVTFQYKRSWPRHEVVDGVPVLRIAGRLLSGQSQRPAVLRKLAYMAAMVDMGWTLWRQRGHYDILHVYKLNILALTAALVCRLTATPMIVAVRACGPGAAAHTRREEPSDVTPPGATTQQSRLRVRPRQVESILGDLEDLERIGPIGVRLTYALLRRIRATVILLSSAMEGYLAEHNVELANIQRIPNGVDTATFVPSTTDPFQDERARVVLCVAGLRHVKGIDVLLHAWRLVHTQISSARLLIVGDGPLQAQLHLLARTLGLADSVVFVGQQTDVLAQYHRGAVAVLPSRYEGMPNAVLEAMACGLACVATRVSGTEDLIQHEVNGLLVDPEDVQSLATALLTLLCDPTLARKYGRAARATIEQHYSVDQIMDTYIELYHRLADGKQPTLGGSSVGPLTDRTAEPGPSASSSV